MQQGMSREELEKLCATLQQTGCTTFTGEAWLKSWKKSTHSALPEVTINLAEDEEIAPFESATVKKGKVAGQRYKVLFFEIGDDEEVVQEEPVKLKGGKLSIEAAGLCNNVNFQMYVNDYYGHNPDKYGAADHIRSFCGVKSRAEIDHSLVAESKFYEMKQLFIDAC
jgi:hypothetical protein